MRLRAGGAGFNLLLRRKLAAVRTTALSRPIDEDEQQRFIMPARLSSERLKVGAAAIDDLHNLCAFFNVGMILAFSVKEDPAGEAIQQGIHSLIAVKDRGGPRYSMNASQREDILEAVRLTDELFCCCTLLEIADAHEKVIRSIPFDGQLRPVQVAL